eukprot:4353234-Prorocentrum_lima.AAC.1
MEVMVWIGGAGADDLMQNGRKPDVNMAPFWRDNGSQDALLERLRHHIPYDVSTPKVNMISRA